MPAYQRFVVIKGLYATAALFALVLCKQGIRPAEVRYATLRFTDGTVVEARSGQAGSTGRSLLAWLR